MTPTTGRRWPIWPWLVLAAAGIGITAVSAFAGAAATSDGDQPTTTRPGTVTVTQVETRTSTLTRTVTATPPPGPGQVDDGLFDVGPDLAPGTYRTEGPDGTNRTGCYWSRIGPAGERIADGKLSGPGTVTLVAGERFDTAGCLPWAPAP